MENPGGRGGRGQQSRRYSQPNRMVGAGRSVPDQHRLSGDLSSSRFSQGQPSFRTESDQSSIETESSTSPKQHGKAAGNGSTRAQHRGRRFIGEIVHTRPESLGNSKKGFSGTIAHLTTNYFRLVRKPEWSIFQYRVDFKPDIEALFIRKALLRPFTQHFNGYLFDGTMIFSSTKLPNDITEFTSAQSDGTPVTISIKYVKEVLMSEMASLQILNIIMRRAMEGLNLQLVGRNFFDAIAKIPVNDFHLELWPGYVTSIRQHETDILLCAELSSKIMRMETARDLLMNCVRDRKDFKEAYAKIIIGTTVLTDYSNKTYRVNDIDWDRNPMSKFHTKSGQISFMEYYQSKYNISIKDVRQPLLLSKSKDKNVRSGSDEVIALIPELCRATGLTDEMRSNFRLMKAVAEHTRIGPAQRVRRLIDFNRRLQNTVKSISVLQDWSLKLDDQLVEVSGRELNFENILFGESREAVGKPEADWTSDFRSNSLFTTVPLNNWCLIVPRRGSNEANSFVRVLQDAVRNMRMRINKPQVFEVNGDRGDEFLKVIDDACNNDPQMIMIVVPNNNSSRYSAIKKKCCIDKGIPTQVIVQKTITPKNGNPRSLMSVATKVAIQLNCKLGASPWFVKIPLKGIMIVGFDVTHDTKQRAISYGAMVATMDMRESTKYFSAVSSHSNGEELSNQMNLNMTKALREYRLTHGTLPSKIIIYRDGVGEGQLHYVVEHELKSMCDTINHHYQNAGEESHLAYVVVNKRINTRIFKNGTNPLPGTVVDDIITSPERYDFFLVSQSVRQGTVSPTSYNVIYDTLQLPPDKMQILTYKMCHLYYNWNGTIRVPHVCQYAHKLAQLVGEHIHQSPHPALEKQLYFL
uniref:CSON003002 protein n=1 Tax=Culicoides sonorensis TaxID=179676 RepID=A0A336LSU2_CULSO